MKDGKPETVANASKRILITNIAMIAKTSASGALDLFAANFADGKPAAGLKAILWQKTAPCWKPRKPMRTDRAHFKSTRGWEREKKPAAAALRSKGTDLAWLSLKDGSNVAETLRWDVGGVIRAARVFRLSASPTAASSARAKPCISASAYENLILTVFRKALPLNSSSPMMPVEYWRSAR